MAHPDNPRSDNGAECGARAILRWLTSTHIATDTIDPGNPWQNGLNESFNGTKVQIEHITQKHVQ